ncbi:MAG TPA: benzoylformate decarboxylase [Micromonosporaceae bacterium]
MTTVRDATFDLLRAHGMTTVFGNPGSTELAFLAGLPDDFRYVLGLHEGAAVGIADGYAQVTGQPALVNLHSAPGVATAMGALVNAAAGRVPLVIISGQQVRSLITMEGLLTNPDPVTLPRPVVKWAIEPPRPQDVPAALARAIAVAKQPPRGPVLVSVPADDWSAPLAEPPGYRVVTGRQAPLPSAIRTVADRLVAATNPVLLVGAGVDAEGGWEAAVVLAERCALPVYWAPVEHRCGFPTAHPAFQGMLPASPAGVRKALQGHDLVLVVGAAAFRYYLDGDGPVLPPNAELVMITSDPDQAARAPVGDAIVGDVGLALRWLVAAVPMTTRPAPPAGPPPPPVPPGDTVTIPAVYAALAALRRRDPVVVAESPSTKRVCVEQLRFARPGSFFGPAGASLGFGLSAAIGVQLGQPDRPVVAVVGDGALQYSAPAMWTAVRHGIPVTVLVLRNDEYAVLKDYRDQLGLSDVPGLDVPGLDNVALAKAYGMPAQRVESVAELNETLRQAIVEPAPRLIEVPVSGPTTALW